MWSRALTFLRDESNRALLGWIGRGLVVLIAGLWAGFVYLYPLDALKKDDGGGAIKVEANCGSAAAQGTFYGSSITVGGAASTANCPPKSK